MSPTTAAATATTTTTTSEVLERPFSNEPQACPFHTQKTKQNKQQHPTPCTLWTPMYSRFVDLSFTLDVISAVGLAVNVTDRSVDASSTGNQNENCILMNVWEAKAAADIPPQAGMNFRISYLLANHKGLHCKAL